MSKITKLLVLLLITLISISTEEDDVLFIGNSMTYYNNLFKVFKGLAAKRGHKLNTKAATNGRKTLIFQSTAKNVVTRVKKGGYEYIILQDIVGGFNGENLAKGGEACVKLCKQYSKNAKFIFYMPWPTKDSLTGKNSLLPYFTYNYIKTAQANGAKLAPAGEVFYDLYVNHKLDFYCGDGKHPQPLGTLVSAASVYYTIFDEEFTPLTNSDQKWIDTLINDNVAYSKKGKKNTYDLDTINLILEKSKEYADAVKKAVADTTGKNIYMSAAGEYEP